MGHASDVNRNSYGKRKPDGPDAAIGALAEGQHGVVGLDQLRALGLHEDHIEYRLRIGRLRLLYRAVYAVGHRRLSREGRWLAAVLAGGPRAALSHRPAAALWGIYHVSGLDVTVPRQRRNQGHVTFHRARLAPDEVTTREGIPVTTVPRTLFDLATILRPRQLEKALNEAEVNRLWDELSLVTLLRRYPRRSGSRAIRALLATRAEGATVTRSELELRFLEFLDETGLPRPQTNQWIEGLEVDMVWREHSLIVELDGYATHDNRAAFERDRRRSRILQAADWRAIPVTHRELRYAPAELEQDLKKMLTRKP